MEYRKNDYVTVTIEDMGSEGEGIGKADGFTLFVKDAVVGDVVEAKLLKVKKNFAYARMEKILTPSPSRVDALCPTYRQCGGCQLQALSYEGQLAFKHRKIRNNLIRIGGFDTNLIDRLMEPIIGMENPVYYRNKAQYPVGTDRNGRLITGFYAGRTHSIISNTNCCLGAPKNEEILEAVLDYMRENRVSAYDEETGRGLVRHILIRKGFTSGEIMVCLVINRKAPDGHKGAEPRKSDSAFLPAQDELIRRLTQIEGMTSISVSINTEKTNVILGREIHVLWGSSAISDTIHVRDMRREGYPFTGQELNFRISPLSFYQVNPVQTEKLYSLALEYAGLTGKETVWDLYCGIGTISLFLAKQAGKVYGVETVPQAIEDARENARRNGITNAEFFVGKAEEVLPDFYEKMSCREAQQAAGQTADQAEQTPMLHPDVIIVDPPRKGCDALCLETILKMQPERIVYVSCDPATLARDMKVLCGGGYELRKVRGVDMFPSTVHVETVCLLSNTQSKKKESYITLDVEMADYYRIKNEGKTSK